MNDEETASKFRRLVELRDRKDTTEVAAKAALVEYREYESELYDELEESPIKGTRRIDLGDPYGLVVFTPRQTYYGRILDQDEALDYFESRAMSDEMTKPQIAKRKLNELVRECLEQGKPVPRGVDFYSNRGISISKKG